MMIHSLEKKYCSRSKSKKTFFVIPPVPWQAKLECLSLSFTSYLPEMLDFWQIFYFNLNSVYYEALDPDTKHWQTDDDTLIRKKYESRIQAY